jgi:hypothetical protein
MPQNAPDKLFTGPSWTPLAIPQADIGSGDDSEFISVHGRTQLLVTNGRDYSRGPIQLISFRPPAVDPPPGPAPSLPVPPSPPPAGKKQLAAVPKAADVLELPARRRCGRRGSIRLRIKNVSGLTFSSAAVFVNGKRVKSIKMSKLSAPIKLSKLTQRKLTVKLVVKTSDGREISRSRKYRACGKKRSRARH